MAIFNQTIFSNLTRIPELLTVAQTFSSGTIGLGIWLIATFGSLFVTSGFNSRESLLASAFVSTIVALFLKFLGLLSDQMLWVSFFLLILALILSRIPGGATGA